MSTVKAIEWVVILVTGIWNMFDISVTPFPPQNSSQLASQDRQCCQSAIEIANGTLVVGHKLTPNP